MTAGDSLCDFLELCPAPVIGVTGTKGKSTLANFLAAMLKQKFSLVVRVDSKHSLAKDFSEITKDTALILELAAPQIAETRQCKKSPYVAVITNLLTKGYPASYHNFQEYLADEKLIFKFQKGKDYLFLNFSDPVQKAISREATSRIYFYSIDGDELLQTDLPELNQKARLGAYVKGKKIYYGAAQNEICSLADIKALGRQNLPSVLAAISIADLYTVPAEKIKTAIKQLTEQQFKVIKRI